MTILVSNIGSVDLSRRSRVGSSGGAASAWLSSSSLGCKAGPGHDVGVSSIATSSRVVASATKAVSYDSQYHFVIRVVPTNGATTGSTSMTVVVSNLGTLSLSERCRMGQSGTQASVWMSSSSVFGKWSTGVESSATACVTSTKRVGSLSRAVGFGGASLGVSSVGANERGGNGSDEHGDFGCRTSGVLT